MMYPTLRSLSAGQVWTEQFLGLDKRPRTRDGAFEAMGNMTGDDWPLIGTRKKRGLKAKLQNPQGLTVLGKVGWIDGGTLYWDGKPTPVSDLSLKEDMLPKRIAVLGAYIVIFPDGKYFNTADETDWGDLERLYESPEGQSVSYSLCAMDGAEYPESAITAGDTPPADPSPGDYWISTGGENHALYQYSALYEDWYGVSSTCVKISVPGIGAGIRAQDGVEISGISVSGEDEALKSQIELLNGVNGVLAAGDDFIVVPGLIDRNYTQTQGRVRADRKIPRMDFIIECDNRLWGCRYGEENGETVNRIYASALGDFKNWQKFQGVSQDSYFVNVGTDGPFTGAAVHRGSPCFFKENCVHKIFGDRPANFQTQLTKCCGVKKGAEDTLKAYNGALYYLGNDGVMYFESLPQTISEALGNEKLLSGAAGVSGGKYYLSAKNEKDCWSLYVFDTERLQWYRQDGSHALAFGETGGETYMLTADGSLYALNGTEGTLEEEAVTWFLETAEMGYEYPEHKYISRLLFRVRLGETADMTVLVQYDSDGIWHEKGAVRGGGKVKTYLFPILPRRCGHMRIRLEGQGDMLLYGLARELALGSEE